MQREMLSGVEVAQILGVSVWTLRRWRCEKNPRSPKFVRVSNRCKYRATDLEEYIRALPTGGGIPAAKPEAG